MNKLYNYTNIFFVLLFLGSFAGVQGQTNDKVSTFLEEFLTEVEDGGVTIDEQYLKEHTDMPEEMGRALRDSLQGRSSFQLTKEKSGQFFNDFSSTLGKYGIQKTNNGFKLKNNRLLNLEVKGPDLSALFGGPDTNTPIDSSEADFKVHDINDDIYQSKPASNLDLKDPSNNKEEVQYDPTSGQYVFSNKIGDDELNMPVELDQEEYQSYSLQNSLDDYWADRSFTEDAGNNGSLLNLGLDFGSSSSPFGKGAINIVPTGYADLTFSIKTSETDNPTLSEDQRKNIYFDLDNKIQMNVSGSIGDKLNLDMSYNTEATFNFDNEFVLEFNGEEDDIVKNFKAGNVSMPSVGSMITVGGSGQSSAILPGYQKLWGFQNTQQYGKLTWSWVVSQQESETKTQTIEGGAVLQDFEITADQYDANRHFFLTHFFKENYDNWMAYTPNVDVSGLNINKIEVWMTNKRGDFDQARNMVAFMDIGESKQEDIDNDELWTGYGGEPSNTANNLYSQMTTTYKDIRDINDITSTLSPLASQGFVSGEDYEKVETARLLSSSEYTVNPTLGYISLNSALNADEVLAVAFQYTYKGNVYQVGEFSSSDGINAPNSLLLKLLKGTNQSPSLPMWDLMMKNIYALNGYNISNEDFYFSVVYQDDKLGTETPYIKEGNIANKTLLKVMGLDTLNSSNEYGSDGFFDWIEGYTILSSNARVIFPVREPFGSHLKDAIGPYGNPDDYIFQELYDTTLVVAQQLAEKNKFRLIGSYQSSSGSEIKLDGMNIPRGSVVVTAGGRQLVENVDYTVDYNSGYLRILDEGVLESGQTIQVSMENQNAFAINKKTLLGTNLVYRFSDDLQIGASITHLSETPQTTKVAVGSDPISNTIWGFTGGWNTDLPFLTRAVDWLPFTDTKAASSMTVRGEVAQLIAGHSNDIGDEGSVYIDDFEATKIGINIQSAYAWDLSSVPDNPKFPEYDKNGSLEYGFNRAKLAWYSIDRIFQEEKRSDKPDHISDDDRSNHYVRAVDERDLFPKTDQDWGESTYITTMDLAYYPEQKGPYNYDLDLDADGHLNNPEDRWAGITRKLETTNFESSNIEYVEFWMMDPFIYDDENDPNLGGQMFINLGNISEDVLKDGRKSFENGLPVDANVVDVDTTIWGRVSTQQTIINAFDNNDLARQYQDIGMDGLNNEDEQNFFSEYIASLKNLATASNQSYIDSLINDPSQDDYHYYRGSDFDDIELSILERYRNYNSHEGNSASTVNSTESYPTAGTTIPDGEDINQDYTLSESDSYYEYSFDINPLDTTVGENYIVDTRIEEVTLANDTKASVKWYQFRVPVHDYEKQVGSISDFTSIRFMRMYMTGFKKPVVLRLVNLELVRSEWRRYGLEIEPDQFDSNSGDVDIEAVNYEENSEREPVNYILPPGVDRLTDPSQPQLTQLNEQSMVMRVHNLAGRDSRAAYKVMQLDLRQYEYLQMWVHSEKLPSLHNDVTELEDGDLALFVRMGSDYNDNYYEYELPLELTPHGNYNSESTTDREIVWPTDNRLDVALELFTSLKQDRNTSDASLTEEFTQTVSDKISQKVKVKGNPSLSNVRMMMIGVRNTKSKTTDIRSAEVWVNELRLTGLNEDGGWAGNGSVSIKIADIGTANASGMFSTAGFGSIEQTLMERQMSDNTSYDVSTSLELGKLLPRKAKIQLPMYYSYSQVTSKPKYDPLNQDLLLQDVLDAAETKAERDEILKSSQSFESRKSINFTNVKVNISGKKKRFYDPVNLALNYSYTEKYSYDETIERGIERDRNFGLNYSFAPTSKPVEPFKKIDILKSDYFALIRDFNFYLKPQRVSFSSNLTRSYFDQQLRDLSESTVPIDIPLQVKKDMFIDNSFSLSYKLAKSLTVDYSNQRYSIVDEIDVVDPLTEEIVTLNKKLYADAYDLWWDAMKDSLSNFGRVMDYAQTFNVRYTLPINKIPGLDFVSVDAAYNATYGWERGTEAFQYTDVYGVTTTVDNGNTIYNTQRGTLNSSLKMNTLYNKSKYLSNISKKYGRIGGNTRKQYKQVKYNQNIGDAKKGEIITINHKLGSKRATVKVVDANGATVYGRKDSKDENTVLFTPNKDISGGKVSVSARVEDVDEIGDKIIGYTLNTLMGIKNVTANITRDGSTTLPGFKPENQLFSSGATPGWGFALGQQNTSVFTGKQTGDYIIDEFYHNKWLETGDNFNEAYLITSGLQVSTRATIEPIAGLNIKLTSSYSTQNRQSAYYTDGNGNYNDGITNLTNTGNFSHTWVALGTLFKPMNSETYDSETYNNFLEFRGQVIAQKEAQLTPEQIATGASYNENSSEILIPAFIAAYSGQDDAYGASTDIKPTWRSMLPNWTVSYSGLGKSKLLKDHVKNLSFSHSYVCTYNVGNYITYTDFNPNGTTTTTDIDGNLMFTSEYDISSVTVTEGLNPLIGVDLTLRNNIEFNFKMNKTRSLALNIASNQLLETLNDEFVIGAGYRFEDLQLFVKTSKNAKGKVVSNDLRLTADFSIRDATSIIRQLEEENVQPSSGSKITAFKIQAMYQLSKSLDITVFYDKQITSPVVSTSYRTANSNFGMTFRFSLTE